MVNEPLDVVVAVVALKLLYGPLLVLCCTFFDRTFGEVTCSFRESADDRAGRLFDHPAWYRLRSQAYDGADQAAPVSGSQYTEPLQSLCYGLNWFI